MSMTFRPDSMGKIPLVIAWRSRKLVIEAYEYFGATIRSNTDGNSIETPHDLNAGAR
jgi:hypothetical protein